MADFRIVSKPVKIAFQCPFCEAAVEIPWGEIDKPDCWSDEWPDVRCPDCEEMVSLGDWEYD